MRAYIKLGTPACEQMCGGGARNVRAHENGRKKSKKKKIVRPVMFLHYCKRPVRAARRRRRRDFHKTRREHCDDDAARTPPRRCRVARGARPPAVDVRTARPLLPGGTAAAPVPLGCRTSVYRYNIIIYITHTRARTRIYLSIHNNDDNSYTCTGVHTLASVYVRLSILSIQ